VDNACAKLQTAVTMSSSTFVERIRERGEPSTRYRLAIAGLGGDPRALRRELTRSPRVAALLSERGTDGRIMQHPYAKWTGAHWVLVTLADLGYPPGDRALVPLREQVLGWLLDPRRESDPALDEPNLAPIVIVAGRARLHASLEGNALYALVALGLADARVDLLARRLVELQWQDGGWNCDRTPHASHSSFEESLIPLRGLIWHSEARKSRASARAAHRAAELFLERRLFRRRTNGTKIASDFTKLHYPCFWHYDILFALKVLSEGGFAGDPRCDEAIAVLKAKRRNDGGYAAEEKYWRRRGARTLRSLVSWGPVGPRHSNEFVTAEALAVLAHIDRARSASPA
jgi:hypothetical protein